MFDVISQESIYELIDYLMTSAPDDKFTAFRLICWIFVGVGIISYVICSFIIRRIIHILKHPRRNREEKTYDDQNEDPTLYYIGDDQDD